MNNVLANSLFRFSSKLTGLDPVPWSHDMQDMQWWNKEQMIRWQRKELEKIIPHAISTVSFYEKTLPPFASRSDRAFDPFAFIENCPVLTKEQVRENFSALQSTSPNISRTLENSTSGSTGKPLYLRVDRKAFARYFAAKLRALAWHDVRFADRQVRVWGLPQDRRKQSYWRLRDRLQNRLRLVSFDLSDERLAAFYDESVRFQPAYINGYTSAIYRFAQFIEENGRDGYALNARVVLPTSEVLLESEAQTMERVFGCPVMNEYGCGEIQAIAYECSAGNLHITHENMYLEVLDENGQTVQDGNIGLLTLTSFCNRAMPLVRYQNGDLVMVQRDVDCDCGRHKGLPVLVQIVGRSSDVLYRVDGQPSHWTVVYYAIKEAFGPGMVVEHQARQRALDRLEIQVVKGPNYQEEKMLSFLERIRQVLGLEMQIDIEFVERIVREESGKLRYFVSDIRETSE